MSDRGEAGRRCRPAGARARGRAPGAIPRRGVGRRGARALRAASRSVAACRPRRCRSPLRSTRVLAHDVVAAVDAPPFDRSNVDGFALRAIDTIGAGDTAPKIFRLNAEVIACGDAPALEVEARHRHHDRDRRRDSARRRRGGDDRADRVDRRTARHASSCAAPPRPGNSSPTPAPTSRAARRCCGAARASARARSACWRPAGLRKRGRGAAAESGGAVDRRRTGCARRAA